MEGKPLLISIREYGLLGSSFYWNRYADYNLTREELVGVGMTDDRVYVSPTIISALMAVDKKLQKRGWRLYLKEGYRSPELYDLIYRKRVAKYGQTMTDRLMNIKDMPHSTGRVVDVAIWDAKLDEEVPLRKLTDGPESLISGFYEHGADMEGRHCDEMQHYLLDLMTKNGFGLGTRREYFHFEFAD